ncbi:MAG: septal ring lytic transglycosylase RlpA family protein [Micromonosporaceae bacterium]|nr:septal ring lytic transglycosylase RlpA family protein [Micromonosporaceae bacterium]
MAGRHGLPRRLGRRFRPAGVVVVTLAVVAVGIGVAAWPRETPRAPAAADSGVAPGVAPTGSAHPDPAGGPATGAPDRNADRPSRGGDPRADRPKASPTPIEPESPAAPEPDAPQAVPGGGAVVETGGCQASFYWEPQPTASGEPFDPEAMTAAHLSWAFDTRVRVTNPATGQSVVVRINDRGPYVEGRCIDLSRGAFREIAQLDAGVVTVTYEVLAD